MLGADRQALPGPQRRAVSAALAQGRQPGPRQGTLDQGGTVTFTELLEYPRRNLDRDHTPAISLVVLEVFELLMNCLCYPLRLGFRKSIAVWFSSGSFCLRILENWLNFL